MVLSKINKSISYIETKKVDPNDLSMEADLYEIQARGVNIIIAIGNAKKDFEENNITFFPIYLVKSNNKVIQIGVYEVKSSDLQHYLDEEGNLEVDKINEPLIYVFVTKQMLENLRLIPESEIEEAQKAEDQELVDSGEAEPEEEAEKEVESEAEAEAEAVSIPEVRKDIFRIVKGIPIPALLQEETKQIASKIKSSYKKPENELWIQQFMGNSNYYIIDNEGGGDCLFATIRDAFSQIAQQTSVDKLRRKLSNEVTQDVFNGYRDLYEDSRKSILKDTEKIKELEAEYEKYKRLYEETLDRNEKKQYVEISKKIRQDRDIIINEKKVTYEISKEYRFMKDVDTIEKFKAKIRTCEFWAETWAISTLERVLNIKFVLLSVESFKNKDFNNVLNCGQANDSIIESIGEFKPEYYVMVEYSGYHYKLIGYKKKQIFKFKELPYDIKTLIVDKCMEKNSGIFSLIPDFIRFKDELTSGLQEIPHFDELSDAKIRGLYEDDVEFVFYDKSANKVPGKGSGEKISVDRVKEFSQLSAIPNWRRKLDNMWIQPFVVDGHIWNSVEHYYQAAKFKGTPEFYLSFSQESGSDLSKDPELAKAASSTKGKHKGELIRPKGVNKDPDYKKNNDKNMNAALYAKFNQNEDLKALLKETKKSKLMHYKKGKEPELAESLIIVRDKLSRL
jgi:predicted NAD-dependent protein-ADP-ribosyltransferase YbiA (DUF1768 family)